MEPEEAQRIMDSVASQPRKLERIVQHLRMLFALKKAQADPQPSMLLDHLYIGSIGAAMHKATLKALGITHILIVAEKLPALFPTDFTYKTLNLLDTPEADLLGILPEALAFITEAQAANGKVLVHCFAGISRSSSVCAAYLMKTQGMRLAQAVEYMRSRRGVVQPNAGFLAQLQSYEERTS